MNDDERSVEPGGGQPVEDVVRELRSARDLIRWGASRFNAAGLCFGHGTDNAVDESLALVLHALHLDPGTPDALLAGRLTRDEKQAVAELLLRRIRERKPSAYLTGKAWFAGLPFHVDERVLVPRSPIAELAEQGFAPWLDAASVRRVLDLGTGSGCIAAACAVAFPAARVDAVDVSAPALEVAERNFRALGVEQRVRAMRSDLFAGVSGPYDLIVSNPPYVDAAELARLPDEYQCEPLVGLSGGEDGLAFVRRILQAAGEYLAPGGVLVVEVGKGRPALAREFAHVPFLWLEFERGGGDVLLLTAEQLQ